MGGAVPVTKPVAGPDSSTPKLISICATGDVFALPGTVWTACVMEDDFGDLSNINGVMV